METKKVGRKHFESREECLAFIDTLTLSHIKNWLASFLMEDMPERMIITEEQFKAFFKIRGINEEGKEERRGRPKKQ